MLYVLAVLLLVSECCGGDIVIVHRATTPKGIPNIRLTCYLNALLQALIATSFVDVVARVVQKNDNAPIARALTTFFNDYFTATQAMVTEAQTRALYDVLVEYNIVQSNACYDDVNVVFEELNSKVDNEFEKCKCVKNPFFFRVVKPQLKNVEEEDIQFRAGGIDLVTDLQNSTQGYFGRSIIQCPQIFLVNITPSRSSDLRVVVAVDKYTFPSILSLKPYMHFEASSQDTEYVLVAIIMYTTGHYTAGCSRFGDQWYFFDDATVTSLPSEVMQKFANEGYFENKTRKFVPRMLFYERTSLLERQNLAHSLHSLSHQLNTFSAIIEKGK